VVFVGHKGGQFRFDNELPRHNALLQDFLRQDRLITNGEYLDFISDDGYARQGLRLFRGWTAVTQNSWYAPLHRLTRNGDWHKFTLAGVVPIDKAAPVTHESYFEADAFDRWAGKRLPTEFEWNTVR